MIPFVMLFLVDVTDGFFQKLFGIVITINVYLKSNNCIQKKCIHCKLYSGNKNDYSYLHSE